MFNQYPYINENDLNLDYLLKHMKNLIETVQRFVALESVSFADPILWDITKQYPKNTIVLNDNGVAYLSKVEVPKNVQLDNEDYWLVIFNYLEYIKSFNSNLSLNVEHDTTRATKPYNEGDWLVYDDILYEVIQNIATDDLFIIDTNIKRMTIEQFIKDWNVYVVNLINQYKSDIENSELDYKNDLLLQFSVISDNLQQQLNNAISGVTADSEVINARVGTNNYIYSTLEERLNDQYNFIFNVLKYLNCGSCFDIGKKSFNMTGSGTLSLEAGCITLNGVESSSGTYNLFVNTNAFPNGLKAGAHFVAQQKEDTNDIIIYQFFAYVGGSWVMFGDTLRDVPLEYIVPGGATGMIVRIITSPQTYSNYKSYLFINNNVVNGYVTKTLKAGTDLNNVVENGSFVLGIGYGYSHAPVDGGYLLNHWHSVPYQIVFDFYGEAMYFRSYVSGAWLDWRYVKMNVPALKKKIAMFGDSIIWSRDGANPNPVQVGQTIPKIVSRGNSQFTADNYGVGGMGWISTANNPQIAYDKLTATDLTGYNVVTYMFGLNDWYQDIGSYLDDETDNTIMGEIYHCMSYVKANYPKVAQVLITMPNSTNFKNTPYGQFPAYDYGVNNIFANNKSAADLHEEMIKFSNYYHIPLIDLNHSGISSFNIESFLPDNIHPNQEGYYILGGYISGELNKILG